MQEAAYVEKVLGKQLGCDIKNQHPETLTPLDLMHKPSLISKTDCPLGDFWGCYGSKIDNSHLNRHFSAAQDDQWYPSCPYPIGAGVYDHHIHSSCIFREAL